MPHDYTGTPSTSHEWGDSPAVHNTQGPEAPSPANQDQLSPEEVQRRRYIAWLSSKELDHDGYSGFYAPENPYHTVDQNYNGGKDIEWDSRKQDPQNWQQFPAPSDKHWNDGYQLQTSYAMKRGMPLSLEAEARVLEAAEQGIPVHQLPQDETSEEQSVSLPVSHITKDLHEMASFMMDDVEALAKAGQDVEKLKELLEQFKQTIPS